MIDSISTPTRSIEYNNRLPSSPPLIARNGPVSRHLVPPQHRADASGSDTNRSRSGNSNNRATARPSTMMFNLEACMAQLGLDVPPTPVPAIAIPTLQVDDIEMADLEEDDDDDEEVAGINSPPLLSFRRSDLNMNLPQLSNRNKIRRISLSPRPSPSSLSSNKHD